MAPNRNNLDSSLHSLKAFDLSEQFVTESKYQTLIPPAGAKQEVSSAAIEANIIEAGKPFQTAINESNKDLNENESYWHMPAEEDKDYFSSAHLENMLVKDAAHRIEKKQQSFLPSKARTSSGTSYWDWSETVVKEETLSKPAMIELILKEESIRQMMTTESVGNNEVQYHRSKESSAQVKPIHCNSMHDSHSYFYFPPQEEDKDTIISRILREESQRLVLLTDSVVDNLISQSKLEEEKVEQIRGTVDQSQQSYWDW